MAEKCFPYNSVNGDRKYKAEEFREYYAQLIGNGVIYSSADALKVKESGGMTVALSKGGAFVAGVGYINTSDLIFTLDTADGALSRVDRMVIRNDYTNRLTYGAVLKGTYSAQPKAPEITRTADCYEIAVGDVLVAKGVVSITQSDITDTRLNSELCGIVTGLIEQADTTEIFNQFEVYFEEFKQTYIAEMESWTQSQETSLIQWMNTQKTDFVSWTDSIKDILDETAAGHLQNEIEAEQERAIKDAFMRYYGLATQETEFREDGSIVAINSEATVTTVFGINDSGQKTITETVVPTVEPTEEQLVYKKVTTIIPETETTNKKISEVYTSEL